MNDGFCKFSNVTEDTGLSMKGHHEGLKVEGAEAIDINEDGWLDLYTGSRLLINQAGQKFVDQRVTYGLPEMFDFITFDVMQFHQ